MAVTTAGILTATSVAASAGGAAMSFGQAAEQKRLQRNAEKAAQDAINEAKGRTEMNFYEELAISMTPYEMEQEALVNAASASLEAAREGIVDPSTTAGRIQMAVNQKAADIRNKQTSQLQNIEQLQAAEDARLNQEYMNILKEESAGATFAASEANNLRNAALLSAMGSLSTGLKTGLEHYVPLYPEADPLVPGTPESMLQEDYDEFEKSLEKVSDGSRAWKTGPVEDIGMEQEEGEVITPSLPAPGVEMPEKTSDGSRAWKTGPVEDIGMEDDELWELEQEDKRIREAFERAGRTVSGGPGYSQEQIEALRRAGVLLGKI